MEEDSNVNLKWDAHQATLKSVFDTLLDTESLADCTIGAEGQHLKAHKIMLSACSQYFELLFRNHNGKHVIIILPGVQFHSLKALVEFMYRGEVLIPQDDIDALLQLADFLQVKGLSFGGNVVSEMKHTSKIRNKSPTSLSHASPENVKHCDSPEILEVSGSSSQSESLQKQDCTKVTPISTTARKRKKSSWHSSREEPPQKQDFVSLTQTVSCNFPIHESEVRDKRNLACGRFLDLEPRPSPESQLHVFSEGNFSKATVSGQELISAKTLNTMVRKSVRSTVRGNNTNLETVAEPKQENCSLQDVILDTDDNQHQNVYDDNSFVSSELTESSFCDEESITQQLQQQAEWTDADTVEQTTASNNRFSCPSCDRSYRYHRDLVRHLKYECGKEPQFQCPHCLVRFTHKHTLKTHMVRHDNLE